MLLGCLHASKEVCTGEIHNEMVVFEGGHTAHISCSVV